MARDYVPTAGGPSIAMGQRGLGVRQGPQLSAYSRLQTTVLQACLMDGTARTSSTVDSLLWSLRASTRTCSATACPACWAVDRRAAVKPGARNGCVTARRRIRTAPPRCRTSVKAARFRPCSATTTTRAIAAAPVPRCSAGTAPGNPRRPERACSSRDHSAVAVVRGLSAEARQWSMTRIGQPAAPAPVSCTAHTAVLPRMQEAHLSATFAVDSDRLNIALTLMTVQT